MTRRTRILWSAAGLVAVAAAALGLVIYRDFYGGSAQFDARFYAQGQTTRHRPFNYDDYAAVLTKYVDAKGMVHYAGLKSSRRSLDDFARALAQLEAKTYDGWDNNAKIAFWINAYNALTLKVILDNYPIEPGLITGLAYPKDSIRQIPGVWDRIQFLVMHKKMTLGHIEHKILRSQFDEPRIHVALVCAAMGCAPLRNEPYVATNLDKQLDDQSRKFLANPAKFRIDRGSGKVYLSSIFDWFGGDFTAKHLPTEGFTGHSDPRRAALSFASKYLSRDDADYLQGATYGIEFLRYDWSLNERSAPLNLEPTTSPATRPESQKTDRHGRPDTKR